MIQLVFMGICLHGAVGSLRYHWEGRMDIKTLCRWGEGVDTSGTSRGPGKLQMVAIGSLHSLTVDLEDRKLPVIPSQHSYFRPTEMEPGVRL
jgi:hypothetical protein